MGATSRYVPAGVPRDLAPLLVGRPQWTRLNLYALRPDTRPQQPVTEAVIVTGYLARLWPWEAPTRYRVPA